jgi:hypothetical protein
VEDPGSKCKPVYVCIRETILISRQICLGVRFYFISVMSGSTSGYFRNVFT